MACRCLCAIDISVAEPAEPLAIVIVVFRINLAVAVVVAGSRFDRGCISAFNVFGVSPCRGRPDNVADVGLAKFRSLGRFVVCDERARDTYCQKKPARET